MINIHAGQSLDLALESYPSYSERLKFTNDIRELSDDIAEEVNVVTTNGGDPTETRCACMCALRSAHH